jgi:hypothetical protein
LLSRLSRALTTLSRALTTDRIHQFPAAATREGIDIDGPATLEGFGIDEGDN